ncbi:MAG TPA: iron-containing alcohol dehydrogenase family protein [Actinomycetota bacterium]
MPLLARTIPAPIAVDIRRGAVEGLARLLADGRISAGGSVAIAVGEGMGEQIAAHLAGSLPSAELITVEGGSMESAHRLAEQLRGSFYDAVVGIGGGGTLDVGKYAASAVGLPFVSVATTLTHDGLASPVAVLRTGDRKGSYGVQLPIAVVVDLDYVTRSPERHTRSGIGDAVSNLSAVADWELAARERREPIDGLAVSLARSASAAVVRRTDAIDSETFLTALAEALILSGLSMGIAGSSRPCSGACHEISHAIDALFPGTGLHGEQVAVGALFASFLRADPGIADLDACLRRYGVPRLPGDLGLGADDFTSAVVKAPETRPDRYTILEHLGLGHDEVRSRVDAFLESFDR